jgi:hypothetical protein
MSSEEDKIVYKQTAFLANDILDEDDDEDASIEVAVDTVPGVPLKSNAQRLCSLCRRLNLRRLCSKMGCYYPTTYRGLIRSAESCPMCRLMLSGLRRRNPLFDRNQASFQEMEEHKLPTYHKDGVSDVDASYMKSVRFSFKVFLPYGLIPRSRLALQTKTSSNGRDYIARGKLALFTIQGMLCSKTSES